MKLYLAAPLFSEAERAFNLAVAQALSAAGHEVYLPQRDTPTVEGAGRTTTLFPGSRRVRLSQPCDLTPIAERDGHPVLA